MRCTETDVANPHRLCACRHQRATKASCTVAVWFFLKTYKKSWSGVSASFFHLLFLVIISMLHFTHVLYYQNISHAHDFTAHSVVCSDKLFSCLSYCPTMVKYINNNNNKLWNCDWRYNFKREKERKKIEIKYLSKNVIHIHHNKSNLSDFEQYVFLLAPHYFLMFFA